MTDTCTLARNKTTFAGFGPSFPTDEDYEKYVNCMIGKHGASSGGNASGGGVTIANLDSRLKSLTTTVNGINTSAPDTSSFVRTIDLASYVTTSDLASYVKTSDLTNTLTAYATKANPCDAYCKASIKNDIAGDATLISNVSSSLHQKFVADAAANGVTAGTAEAALLGKITSLEDLVGKGANPSQTSVRGRMTTLEGRMNTVDDAPSASGDLTQKVVDMEALLGTTSDSLTVLGKLADVRTRMDTVEGHIGDANDGVSAQTFFGIKKKVAALEGLSTDGNAVLSLNGLRNQVNSIATTQTTHIGTANDSADADTYYGLKRKVNNSKVDEVYAWLNGGSAPPMSSEVNLKDYVDANYFAHAEHDARTPTGRLKLIHDAMSANAAATSANTAAIATCVKKGTAMNLKSTNTKRNNGNITEGCLTSNDLTTRIDKNGSWGATHWQPKLDDNCIQVSLS
jgi:uncharacterized protein (UPF0333 family)